MQHKKYSIASAVCLCFRYSPGAAFVKLLVEIANGILMPLMVLVVAYFIDAAIFLAEGDGRISSLAAAIALMAAYYAYSQISHILIRIADKSLENGLRENLRPQLIRKQAHMSFSLSEDPKTLDLITYVCGNAEKQITAILDTGIGIIRIVIQVSGMFTLIAVHAWWILPLFILSAVPIALIARKGGKAIYASDIVTTKLTRMHYYLSSILVGRETAAERTLFGYTDNINKKFSAAHLKRSNMVTKEIAVKEITVNACGFILNALVLVAVFALLGSVGDNRMSHGLYVSLVGALIGLARMITGCVSRLVSDATGYIAYMRDYTRFFALPESESDIQCFAEKFTDKYKSFTREDENLTGGQNHPPLLEIRNLRFRYTPESDYVLNGVNLVIEQGKSYSLIGQNGAGKSTLTKILLGLYRDFEGDILINGRDIAQYGTDELRSIFSIVYQDFAKYYISLRNNITLGCTDGNLESSMRLSELDDVAAKLPKGRDTPLGKIYNGGTDISGGEWQKVAIARALYANAPFMILDEPTASLSPITESKLYRRFAEITKEKTSLLISHRLGSTKLSDVLFVLDNGVIAETGTHDELMTANGIYAEMFAVQRSWYDE